MNHSIETPSLLAFGEILWDVVQGREHIGGAPFNLAAHAVQCGLKASLFSRVGCDDRGRRALAALGEFNVDPRWVQNDEIRPTGWVDVILDDLGQPSYEIAREVAWDAIEAGLDEEEILRANFQAICFGTLAQRSPGSHEALRRLRALLPQACLFYDVNLRPPHTCLEIVRASLPGVSVLKVNEGEAETLAGYLWGRTFSPEEFSGRMASEFAVPLIVVTKADKGCLVLENGRSLEIPAIPVQVASAVGAGDAFSAAFLSSWLLGKDVGEAVHAANALGAFVAASSEAIPKYSREKNGEIVRLIV